MPEDPRYCHGGAFHTDTVESLFRNLGRKGNYEAIPDAWRAAKRETAFPSYP